MKKNSERENQIQNELKFIRSDMEDLQDKVVNLIKSGVGYDSKEVKESQSEFEKLEHKKDKLLNEYSDLVITNLIIKHENR